MYNALINAIRGNQSAGDLIPNSQHSGGGTPIMYSADVCLACFGPLAAHTQVLSVPSSLALMILDLSNATASTMPSWPRRVMVHSPVVRSVTVMVPSVLPDTTCRGEPHVHTCKTKQN